MVVPEGALAGDVESVNGFEEGMSSPHRPDLVPSLIRHDTTSNGVEHGVRRAMGTATPPTALVVANAYHYLTVVSCLSRLGLRVPEDVSLVSRDNEQFLSYLRPELTRYVLSDRAMAKSLLRLILAVLDGDNTGETGVSLMPELLLGGSVARPGRD